MAKKFKAHMMYKGKKSVMAKTMADHLRLKKQGYGHKAPSYDKGGKLDEPAKKGHQIPETTVTAALPSKLPTAKEKIKYTLKTGTTASEWEKKQHPSMRRVRIEPIGGNAPMVGGAKVLGFGKSAFNLMKSAPSLFSRIAPKAAEAIGEGIEAKEVVKKAKRKFNKGGIMPNVKPDNREKLVKRYKGGGKVSNDPPKHSLKRLEEMSSAIEALKTQMREEKTEEGMAELAKLRKDYKTLKAEKLIDTSRRGRQQKASEKGDVERAQRIFETRTLREENDDISVYKKGGKVKSKVNEAGNYTKPAMRKRLFNRIKAGTKGGRAGQWSARKAQLLAKLYEKNGGGYR